MRRRPVRRLHLVALPCAVSLVVLSACATRGTVPASARPVGAPPAAGAPAPQGMKASLPAEVAVGITLREGQAWPSRFVSTSETTRTFTAAGGKEAIRARAVGLELVATEKVVSLAGGKARIEVVESSAKILQDGTFIDAPFKRFNPPNPVYFTLDVAAGTADFAEMEKAYEAWMAGLRAGPAGDIFGKTFRLEAYVAQLKELYAKPFTRFAGKTLSKEPKAPAAKEFVLPFLGPGVALGPVPVETTTWIEGFEAKGGSHLLAAAGRYDGTVAWTAGELADRLADFGAPAPAAFRSSGEAHGRFTSAIDLLTGREIRSESQLRYSTRAEFDGGTLSEEITGKSILEPAD